MRMKIFWIVTCLSRVLLIVFVLTSGVGLMPDEAQYFTWSCLPDIGYYSKPPGIAWQIYLGTCLFGDGVLGVRIISILLPVFMAILIQKIATLITHDENTGYLSGTAFILSPLGMSASIFATTDGGMLFWALLGTYFYLKEKPSQYTSLGLCIAFGAAWKWMIYSLLIPYAIYDVIILKKRPTGMLQASLISLLGLIPSLIWNMEHSFATFQHVGGTVFNAHASQAPPNPLSFLLAGIALLSPGFFLLSLPNIFSKKRDAFQLLRLCVWFIWGGLVFLSCFRKVQGNWAVLGQIMVFPLLGYSLLSYKKSFFISVLVSLFLQLFFLAAPYTGGPLLTKSPLKQGIGVEEIRPILEKNSYTPEKFLFSDRYQTVSQVWFYMKKKTYFLNLSHLRHNQFCFWPGMQEECLQKSGYFLSIIPQAEKNSIPTRVSQYEKKLLPYFDHVGEATVFPLGNQAMNFLLIIPVDGYNGCTPEQPDKF